MKRRELITLLGGAVALPLAARAQQPERMRRIGVLTPLAKDNPETQARIAAFLQELQRLGWTDGRNLQVEYRWDTGDPSFNSKAATELVTLSPDVILSTATVALAALQQATQTVPIVFVQVADPVGRWLCCQPGKAWRQYNRVHEYRLRDQCEMAGTAQGNCSLCDTCWGHSRPNCNLWCRPVRRDPVGGAGVWSAGECAWWARRRRR